MFPRSLLTQQPVHQPHQPRSTQRIRPASVSPARRRVRSRTDSPAATLPLPEYEVLEAGEITQPGILYGRQPARTWYNPGKVKIVSSPSRLLRSNVYDVRTGIPFVTENTGGSLPRDSRQAHFDVLYQLQRSGVPTAFHMFGKYQALWWAYTKRICDLSAHAIALPTAR